MQKHWKNETHALSYPHLSRNLTFENPFTELASDDDVTMIRNAISDQIQLLDILLILNVLASFQLLVKVNGVVLLLTLKL